MTTHPHQTRSRRRQLTSSEDNSMTFDVIHSGPTRTTSTLTPTTLRNIEQSFLDIEEANAQQNPNQAGFVPPFIPFQQPSPPQHQQNNLNLAMMDQAVNNNSSHSLVDEEDEEGDGEEEDMPLESDRANARTYEDSMDSDSMSNGSLFSEKTTTSTPPPASHSTKSSTKTPARRGGRRPNKSNLSPEEEEKRSMRRERNKLAAARCRKRRVDHTNELTGEVDGLEKKKQLLQNDIKQLQVKKEELEFLLEAHRDHCRLFGRSSSPPDVKPQLQQQLLAFADKIKMEPVDFDAPTPPPAANTDSRSSSSSSSTSVDHNLLLHNNPLMSSVSKNRNTPTSSGSPSMIGLMIKPSRPSSLAVPFTLTPSQTLAGARINDFSGIPISTPSTGIFNFDSLMDGGTGLTPVSGPLVPTSTGSLAQSSHRNPLELVTPTSEPSKLVSL